MKRNIKKFDEYLNEGFFDSFKGKHNKNMDSENNIADKIKNTFSPNNPLELTILQKMRLSSHGIEYKQNVFGHYILFAIDNSPIGKVEKSGNKFIVTLEMDNKPFEVENLNDVIDIFVDLAKDIKKRDTEYRNTLPTPKNRKEEITQEILLLAGYERPTGKEQRLPFKKDIPLRNRKKVEMLLKDLYDGELPKWWTED